jgi:hypothetical protein
MIFCATAELPKITNKNRRATLLKFIWKMTAVFPQSN